MHGKVVISGASGFIGGHLVRHFLAKGWTVIALVRAFPSKPLKDVEYRLYDLLQAPAVDLFREAAYFIHAAYLPNNFDCNVTGAKQLLACSRQASLRRNVFISSFSSSVDSESLYGRQKYAIEQLFCRDTDTIVRPGAVLGDGGLFSKMNAHIAAGKRIPLIQGGRQPMQTIAVDDLCLAIEHILLKDLSGVFNVAEPESLTYKEFFTLLGEFNGRPARCLPIPFRVLLLVLKMTDAIGLKLPVGRESLLGLKMMRFRETTNDLALLGLHVKSYKQSLKKLFLRG